MTNSRTTASHVRIGQTLHTVDPVNMNSAVFDLPIDAEIIDVRPTADFETTHVTIELVPVAPATRYRLNLPVGRGVTVTS